LLLFLDLFEMKNEINNQMKINKNKEINEALNVIFDLFIKNGKAEYHGEPVSVLEHSLQTAKLAQKANSKNYVILAAFLHDIGHLLVETEEDKMGEFGHISHEKMGANKILDLGFSEKIAELILNHVQAKRYLVSKFPSYFEKLSVASIETLTLQGGKMDKLEMEIFERTPQFKNSLLLRIWDDQAKMPNQHISDLGYYYDLAQKHLLAMEKLNKRKKKGNQ
jgi:2-amino-1-hydroxyethylphosphonate dioxygenase (glycine-forming)